MKEFLDLYKQRKKEIKARLEDFKKIKTEEDLFYELCFCLLTPGSNAKRCDAAVKLLREMRFKQNDFMPREFIWNVRFYNNKSQNLILAKKNFNTIIERLSNVKNDYKLREWIASNVRGLGYKEASHFLRNIGRGKRLAILDRHILKNLNFAGVIENVPERMSKKQYLEIEEKLLVFSKEIKIRPDELDLLFWSKETGEIFK